MINPRELRLGNLVFHQRNSILSEISIIKGIFQDSVFVLEYTQDGSSSPKSIESIDPIPITEEWLIKFGAIQDKHTTFTEYILRIDEFELKYNGWGKGGLKLHGDGYYDYEGELSLDHIKYIHQLQNLYFSLTGQELELKENVR